MIHAATPEFCAEALQRLWLHRTRLVTITKFCDGEDLTSKIPLSECLKLPPDWYLVDCPLRRFPSLCDLVQGFASRAYDDWRRWVPQPLWDLLGVESYGVGWLLVGPAGASYATHQDLHGMHAWVLELQGTKELYAWPPETAKADRTEATAHKLTLRAGDAAYIPSNWWHKTRLLEPCVAVTANFVDRECAVEFSREVLRDVFRCVR